MGKQFILSLCFGASERKWMESMCKFANKWYVLWKDLMSEFSLKKYVLICLIWPGKVANLKTNLTIREKDESLNPFEYSGL